MQYPRLGTRTNRNTLRTPSCGETPTIFDKLSFGFALRVSILFGLEPRLWAEYPLSLFQILSSLPPEKLHEKNGYGNGSMCDERDGICRGTGI